MQIKAWAAGFLGGTLLVASGGYADEVPGSDRYAADEHAYVGAAKCRTCHKKALIGNQYGYWLERDPHRNAWETLESPESIALAKAQGIEGPPTQAGECLHCHQTGFGLSPARFAYRLAPEDGVQCESCHGPGRDYRKKKIMSDPERSASEGLWPAGDDPAICTACHNPESPTFRGFDFEEAKAQIAHPIPADVKGHFIELEKAAKKAAREGG